MSSFRSARLTIDELIRELTVEAAALSSITHRDRHAQLMRDAARRLELYRKASILREAAEPAIKTDFDEEDLG